MLANKHQEEPRLGPYKSDGITPSERYLSKLCRRSFLGLWSYPNLHTDDGRKAEKGVGHELCDLLVVFGNNVIIFSDKHLSAWYYGLICPDILNYLPHELVKENLISRPIICGSTYSEFIKNQKIKQKKMTFDNPYTTYESYIATIIHEFGHVIYDFPIFNKKQIAIITTF